MRTYVLLSLMRSDLSAPFHSVNAKIAEFQLRSHVHPFSCMGSIFAVLRYPVSLDPYKSPTVAQVRYKGFVVNSGSQIVRISSLRYRRILQLR